jgi:exopolysaccharide production protein ExoY
MSAQEATDIHQSPSLFAAPLGGMSKRLVDIVLSMSLLVILAPLILVAGLAVWLTDRGPVFFRHTRLGYSGRSFGCLKIRTMVTNSAEVLADLVTKDAAAAEEWAETQKLRDDPRVTSIGKILRKTSIDELPQLLNVLRGEMSLVGPRPIVAAEVERYGSRFSCYQVARPGITGLWQVGGRSDCTYADRIIYDSDYVNNWSMLKDFIILIRTVKTVVAPKGSY